MGLLTRCPCNGKGVINTNNNTPTCGCLGRGQAASPSCPGCRDHSSFLPWGSEERGISFSWELRGDGKELQALEGCGKPHLLNPEVRKSMVVVN